MLKSLIVMIALMFTIAAALAQETPYEMLKQCRNISQSFSLLRGFLEDVMPPVELVPPDEADYIRKEEDKALQQTDPNRSNRLSALYNRRFYNAAAFHKFAGRVMENLEAAEHATATRDVARHLIRPIGYVQSRVSYALFH